jgi:hypothetical protein
MMRHRLFVVTCWCGLPACLPACVLLQVEELVPEALGKAGLVYEHVLGEEK